MTGTSSAQAVRLAAAAAILLGGGYAVAELQETSSSQSAASGPQPAPSPGPGAGHHEGPAGAGHQHEGDDHAAHTNGDGRTRSAAGYSLRDLRLAEGVLTFRIHNDRSGRSETSFPVVHTKQLHMFVISSDLGSFHHVHPDAMRSGRWRVRLPELEPGEHRVVTEFSPASEHGAAVMLGAPVTVPGKHAEQRVPPPANTTTVDGYTVTVDANLLAGRTTQIGIAIDQDGSPPTLKPYLGSWSHVALVHADTLAVTHLHPLEEYATGTASPEALTVNASTGPPGDYRLIVEFATATGLHQAELTLSASR